MRILLTAVAAGLVGGAAPPAPLPAAVPAAAAPAACLPGARWGSGEIYDWSDARFGNHLPVWLRVAPDGTMTWNREPVSVERVVHHLGLIAKMNPPMAIIIVRPPETSCARVGDAASLVQRNLGCGPGLCWVSTAPEPEPPRPPAPPPPPPGAV